MNKLKFKSYKKTTFYLKIVSIILGVIIFLGAMFVAMNETNKTQNAQAIEISAIKNGFELILKDKAYQIKTDNEKINEYKNLVVKHKGAWPIYAQIIDMANELAKKIADLI